MNNTETINTNLTEVNPTWTAELLHFQNDDLLFYEEFKTVTYGDALYLAELELADAQAVVVGMYEVSGIVYFNYNVDGGTAVLTMNPGFGAQLSFYNQNRAVEFFWHI